MESRDTVWRPSPTVCRCCFNDGCYKDISTEYFWMGKREVYSEMLTETLDVSISYSQSGGPNSNSRLICEPCIARLRDASEFKKQVLECEKMFLQQLDPDKLSTPAEVEVQTFESQLKTEEEVKIEKRISIEEDFTDNVEFGTHVDEIGDDDDDDDLDDQPLTKLASKIPKKEKVDLMDLVDNVKATEKRKSSSKVKSSPPKRAKTKTKLKIKSDAAQPSPTPSGSKVVIKKQKADPSVDPVRRNAELILKYTTANPFRVHVKNILCVYCLDEFEDPKLFRQHIHDEHQKFNIPMVFVKLQKSEYVKVDFTNLTCRICSQKYHNLDNITKHLTAEHKKAFDLKVPLGVMPYLLEKDTWNCAICSKYFPSLLHLNKHTTTHFSSHVCDVCGKSYVSTTGLLQHVRNTHQQDSKPFCRRCKTTFSSNEAKKAHEKKDKSCMPYCCSECPERFPNWDLKQRHLVEAHGYGTKALYPCTKCDMTFKDRRTFYEHYKISHSQECLVCVHCGLKFCSNSRLSRHLTKHAL